MIHHYPLVKIGTQYWMRSNLATLLYINGGEIPKLTGVAENAVGYLQSGAENYLNTASVALSGEFLPIHWGVPNWEDWNILKSYLEDDASLLKSGDWLSVNGAEIFPANNYSGFNGSLVGMCIESKWDVFAGKFLAYWTLSDTNAAIAADVFYLKSDANTMGEAASGIEKKAFTIRCIRK